MISFVFTQNIPEASPKVWSTEFDHDKSIKHKILASKVGRALREIFK
jgi:hypothetical protein